MTDESLFLRVIQGILGRATFGLASFPELGRCGDPPSLPSNSSYYHHHTIPHQAVIQCLVVVVCLPLRIDCDKVGDKSSVVPYHNSRPLPLLEAPGGPPKDYQTHGRSTVAAAAQPLIDTF